MAALLKSSALLPAHYRASCLHRQVFYWQSSSEKEQRPQRIQNLIASLQHDKRQIQKPAVIQLIRGERERKNREQNHFYAHDARGSSIQEQGLPSAPSLWSDSRRDVLSVCGAEMKQQLGSRLCSADTRYRSNAAPF